MALLGHALARAQSVGCTVWEWSRNIQGEHIEQPHQGFFSTVTCKNVRARRVI